MRSWCMFYYSNCYYCILIGYCVTVLQAVQQVHNEPYHFLLAKSRVLLVANNIVLVTFFLDFSAFYVHQKLTELKKIIMHWQPHDHSQHV